MDELAKIEGREISHVLEPTIGICSPLLEERRAYIQEIPVKTFSFGPTERHQLDVFYPLAENKLEKSPVLFFVYGGSYISGARNLSAKFGLVYACVGAFFARRGIVTVIADYRLAPEAKYPTPVEDVRDAMEWAVANPEALVSPGSPSPDLDNLFVLGHSAGATHAATLLFNTEVVPLDSPLRSRISGAILFAGGYDLSAALPNTPRAQALEAYWGTLEFAKEHDALTLFKKFPEAELSKLPGILMVQAEDEPWYLDSAGQTLRKALSERLKREQKMIIGEGHNHISVNWVLGIGEGEAWAEEVTQWILAEPSSRV